MKNLCRKGKVQVHPSPNNPAACRDAYSVLRLLPVAITALSAALLAEDREVLAYFIARSLDVMPLPDKETKKNRRGGGANRKSKHGDGDEEEGIPPWGGGAAAASSSSLRKAAPLQKNHPASFECSCFQCYTSFWSRWDASPEREIIHQAIDLFEEHMAAVAAEAEATKVRKTRKGSKKDDKNANSNPKVAIQEEKEKEKDEVFEVTDTRNERDEDLKSTPRSKQIVPIDFEEGNDDNKASSQMVEEVRAGACPLEGRSLMRRMFPDIMGFVADHLWTAWSSPVRATNA